MSQDRRGFVYRLEPLRLQARWKLDTLRRELAASAEALADLKRRIDELEAHKNLAVRMTQTTGSGPFDPSQAHRRLTYLTDVLRRQQALAEQAAEAQRAHDDLQAGTHAAQLKLDAIERDSERCLGEFLAERSQKAATDADQDWLARAEWRRLQGVGEARLATTTEGAMP